ncbi:MAG: DNA primase [Candidatus Marinimicrobia bacterium]|nr:DNA primase [Candidatus Neomarinimicrobiota bacterium]
MARISQETIDRIRHAADILDVISQYVNLKKRGRNYFGLCPFHHERTPSFSVAPEKEIYHCFGCGAGGSVFNFLMEHENLSFVESIQQLGRRYGIEVELTGDSGTKRLFTQLYEIHEMATNLYYKNLFSARGKAALEYLINRGLSEKTIKTFRVGFAHESWDNLTETVRGEGFSRESIEKSGLFGKGKQGPVDRFRSRIMFPIMNRSNKVIAFGGRAFESDDPAKYMNSPETPLYHKSEVFYGYHKTAPDVRNENSAVLVEGYMDFLQMVQGGIQNVLAVSGTAFTDRHALQIGKITQKVYLMYDGDEAGKKAALRAGYSLLKNSIEALVVNVPENLDPDDWIRKDGVEVVREGISGALPLLKHHLQVTDAKNLPAVERSNFVKEILTEIVEIRDGIIRDDLLQTLANDLKINDQELIRQLKEVASRKRLPTQDEPPSTQTSLFTTVAQKAQVEILTTLVTSFREVKQLVNDHLDLISEPLLNKAASLLLNDNFDSTAAILEQFDDKVERENLTSILMDDKKADDPQSVIQECLITLKSQPIKDKIEQARLKMRELEAAGQDAGDIILEERQLRKQLLSISQNIGTDNQG